MIEDHVMTLDDTFVFGPWEGHRLISVLERDPEFVALCVSEEIVEFDDEALREIDSRRVV